MAGGAGGTFTLKNRAEDQRSPRPAFSLSHDSVSPYRHTGARHPMAKTPWALTAEGKPPADNAHRRFRERRGCRVRPYRPGAGLSWSLTTALRPALAPSQALLGLRDRLLVPREWLSPAIARGARSPLHPGFTPILEIPAAPPLIIGWGLGLHLVVRHKTGVYKG